MATTFASLMNKRGLFVAVAAIVAAVCGADLEHGFHVVGFWDGPH